MTTPTPTLPDLAQQYRSIAEMLDRKDQIARQIADLKAEDKTINRALRKLKTGDLKATLDATVAGTPDPDAPGA